MGCIDIKAKFTSIRTRDEVQMVLNGMRVRGMLGSHVPSRAKFANSEEVLVIRPAREPKRPQKLPDPDTGRVLRPAH
jgi:hypothetical protein